MFAIPLVSYTYVNLVKRVAQGLSIEHGLGEQGPDTLAVEMVESFGMAVGKEVFETVFWVGRFCQAWEPNDWHRVYRKEVKIHLCRSHRAKDGNIRQALIDRFSDGRGKDVAIGKKANPGPLFGVSADSWSALAVAVTYAETIATGVSP